MFDLPQYEIAIELMGLSICLFMAIFFFTDSKDKTTTTKSPRRFLAGFMLVYSITFFDSLLMVSDINANYPHTFGVFLPVYFLLGPFLYFYIRDMCGMTTYILVRPRLKHFIIPIASVIILIPFYILPPSEKQLIFSKNLIGSPETILPWVAIFCILIVHVILLGQILFYLVQSFRVLMRYFSNLKQFFSNIEDNQLGWLRILIVMLSLSWAIYTYEALLAWPDTMTETIRFSTSLIDVGIIYFISFKGLRQIAVFRDQNSDTEDERIINSEDKNATDEKNLGKQKYAKSALNDGDTERILSKLQKALLHDQLYNDSMLSLRGLSDHTGISTNYISQVINQKTDSHFFDYINSFRIDAAKQKLTNNQENKSILDIAYDVGFNSKSTFNMAFKRYTGQTPSEYRKTSL